MNTSRARWLTLSWLYLKRILLLNAAFVLIGFFWRWAFYQTFGNPQELQDLGHDLLSAFVLGARFDSTVLFYIDAIPFLVLLILSLFAFVPRLEPLLDRLFSHFTRFLVPYFTVMLFIVTFVSAVDFGFYSFYQDRINVLIFGYFEDDTWALTKTMYRNYPVIWIFLGLGLFTYLLWKGTKINFTRGKEWIPLKVTSVSYGVFVLFFFTAFVLNGIGARGTLALFPLSEMDTGISKSLFINQLSFNGVRALGRAVELKSAQTAHWDSNLKYFGYGDDYRQAFADFYDIAKEQIPADPLELMKSRTAKNDWAEKTRPHVLLLVMESFGAYWTRYDQPEFDLMGDLKKHFNEDTFLNHFLSSTNATIGSLSCLMISAPQRPISAFLTESDYLQVPFRSSVARTYKQAGYRARFLYGGNPGWREVNKFAHIQGFDTIEGDREMLQHFGTPPEAHDWGVYDEDFFRYIEDTLKEAKGPEFLLAMTTTNHPPYQLPSSYQSPTLHPPEELKARLTGDTSLAEKRFRTYRYSSQKLAEFLDRIKASPLKDKLIIAITGDHTFWIVNFSEEELLQKGSVPFYLYLPKAIKKNLPANTFGSHADIAPTLYNLSLSNQEYYSIGADLFQSSSSYALNAGNLIVDENGGVLVTKNAAEDHHLQWQDGFERLTRGESSDHQQNLAKKYRSLMGILDYYFMTEKKGNQKHADSGR